MTTISIDPTLDLDPREVSQCAYFTIRPAHGYDRAGHLMIESADGKYMIILDEVAATWKAAGVPLAVGDRIMVTLHFNKILTATPVEPD